MSAKKTILIGDRVTIAQPGHAYSGVPGAVRSSRIASGGGVEHQVEFPRRKLAPDEVEHFEGVKNHTDIDLMESENIVWLMGSEIQKIT